jgi:hypothetical protein
LKYTNCCYVDTEEEAARLADYMILYYRLERPLNFDRNQYDHAFIAQWITDYFKGIRFRALDNKWIVYVPNKDATKWSYYCSVSSKEEAIQKQQEYINNLQNSNT